MQTKKLISGLAALSLLAGVNALYAEPKVEFGGTVEVELASGEEFDGSKVSDITLATVELGADITINENVSASLLFLFEEDDTPFELDEGTITFHNLAGAEGLSLTGGQMYVPFGSFETNMVSDPYTLEIGETRKSALLLGYETGGLSASIYVFNGETTTDAQPLNPTDPPLDDKINHHGFSLSYSVDSFGFGVDYISSLAETDGLVEGIVAVDNGTVADHVPAIAVHGSFTMGAITVLGEIVQAQDPFAVTEYNFNGNGAEFSATHLEVAYGLGDESTVSLTLQQTKEALALELPESAVSIAYRTELPKGATLAVEYTSADDYGTSDKFNPGTGDETGSGESADTITVQVAVEF